MQKPSRRSRLLWVLPPVAFLAALLLWFVAECVRGAAFPEPWNAPAHSQWISFPFEILVAASALVLAGAPFVAAISRRGGAAALLFASWIPCFIAFFFIGFMSERDSQNRWDRFADRLEIPEGLDVSEPVGKSEAPDIGFAALPADSADAAALCLRDCGMGCYAAAIFLRTAEPGRIRLRAVEVTTGHSLSPYELDGATSSTPTQPASKSVSARPPAAPSARSGRASTASSARNSDPVPPFSKTDKSHQP